jgi:4-amino-4-deoxy-L-arabinose transferase-like glycosyltransferase
MTWLKNPVRQPQTWFYLFILLHITVWTLVPFFTRYNLPMDALEGTIWGHQFEWGYDKNPFLNGWLTAVALQLGGPLGLTVYLFSQLSVAVCFCAVWKLAKKMLPPIYALLAVLLLEGAQYYNLHAIDFNDNTLELALWALTSLFFHDALKHQTAKAWILTGFFAACGMMTKYYAAMLLLPMMFFLLVEPACRRSFFNPWFYASLLVFGLVITPHIIWLFQHDFVTVNYALERISSNPTWFHHINYAASFAWEQFAVFLPPFCLAGILMLGRSPALQKPRLEISAFDQQFLLYLGLGPILLTVLLSALTGIKLRAG